MAYVIGIDGGGSKCLSVIVDYSGKVLGTGLGGPTRILYNSREAVMTSLRTSLQQASGNLNLGSENILIFCGTSIDLARELTQESGLGQCLLKTEYELGMASVMQTYGILVLSGTGSVIYGSNKLGMHCSMGGQGPLFADEGSGFHIGQLGFRAAFRANYGNKYRTVLAETIPKLYGLPNLGDLFTMLLHQNGKESRKMIALAAKAVNQAAESGDLVAVNILRQAAGELVQMLPDIVNKLQLTQPQVPMVASGSVALKSKIYWQTFCEQAKLLAPNLTPLVPTMPPACGAAMIGLQARGLPWTTQLLNNMTNSYNQHTKNE